MATTTDKDIIRGGLIPMEKLLKEAAGMKIYKEGDSIDCIVDKVTKNKVFVTIDDRIHGIVGGKELMYDPQFVRGLVKGDVITAFVIYPEDDEGTMLLSLRKANRDTTWTALNKKMEDKESLAVVVSAANKGGLIIEMGGIKGFLPVSQLSAQHYPRVEGGNKDEILSRLGQLVGKTIDVKIHALEKSSNKLIFSEREAIGNRDVPKDIAVGAVVTGTVIGIVDFGFFVDVGGVEGLVHISEISWGKVEHIADFVKIGDTMKLKVIDIENSRLSLSLKQLDEDPWKKMVKELSPGAILSGRVSRLTPYGAFVKVKLKDAEIDALVHISEISHKHLTDPAEVLALGDQKEFKVLSIDPEQHRLSLSLKALEPGGEEATAKKAPKAKKAEVVDSEEESGESFASLGAAVLKKLNAGGISSMSDIKGKTVADLTAIEGIGEKTAEKIVQLAQ
ncbi:MAG: S1 RNA-binding domain-containing protein [Patescibacteria group bacterium]